MKNPFVTRKKYEKTEKTLERLINDLVGERNRMVDEIKNLRTHASNQDWYRETWGELIERQNGIMSKQSDSLELIAKHLTTTTSN